MTMDTTLIHLNDVHLAAKNPVSRTDDYNGALLTKLGHVLTLAVRVKADAICLAGDLFHDKHPHAKLPYPVLYGVVSWLVRCRREAIPVLVIAGNHDEIHDRLDSVPHRPLGLLIEAGLIFPVGTGYHAWTDGQVVVAGVPWPTAAQAGAFADLGTPDVVLAHAYATPEGEPLWGQFCHRYDDLAKAAPRVRIWHFGHDHSDRGVYRLRNGAKVINIGALSRGALDTDTLTRTVKIAISRIPPGDAEPTVQQVALPVAPVDTVFNLPLRAQKAKEHAQIERFVEQLSAGLAGQMVDYRAALDGMTLPEAVRQLIHDYLARAEASAPVSSG